MCHLGPFKRYEDLIEGRAATYAEPLRLSIADVLVIVWLDTFKKQRYGPNHLNLDKSLDSSAIAMLHTTELPHFGGQPNFRDLLVRSPEVAAALVPFGYFCAME